MPEAAALLRRLDAIVAEMAELRAEMVELLPSATGNGLDASDDGLPEPLLDATAIAAELNIPIDTVRYAARHKHIGHKQGGVWRISLPRARQWFRR